MAKIDEIIEREALRGNESYNRDKNAAAYDCIESACRAVALAVVEEWRTANIELLSCCGGFIGENFDEHYSTCLRGKMFDRIRALVEQPSGEKR